MMPLITRTPMSAIEHVQTLTLCAWLAYLEAQLRAAESDAAAADDHTPERRSASARARYFATAIATARQQLLATPTT